MSGFMVWFHHGLIVSAVYATLVSDSFSCVVALKSTAQVNLESESSASASKRPGPTKLQIRTDAKLALNEARRSWNINRGALKNEIAIISFGRLPRDLWVERMALLEGYRPYFRKLIFLSHDQQLVDESQGNVAFCDIYNQTWSAYTCVARLLSKLPEPKAVEAPYGGVTYFHFDMWMHPSYLANFIANNPNMVGLVSEYYNLNAFQKESFECADADVFGDKVGQTKAHHRWGGRFDQANLTAIADIFASLDVRAATESDLEAVRAQNQETSHRRPLCLGWSDLYRIPRLFWPAFTVMARSFEFHEMARVNFHEIVMPTVLQRLATGPLAAKLGVQNVTPVDCWGAGCVSTDDPGLLHDYGCGHKMDLSKVSIRDAVACEIDESRQCAVSNA